MNRQSKRQVLGRGLSNLIPVEDETGDAGSAVISVDIHALRPNPFQPRDEFDEKEIEGLAESIGAQGLLQPILVRKKLDGYEIISGERRVRAVKKLGWNKVPCVAKAQISDRKMLELALVENIQRENLNDIESAKAYHKLLLECSLSHEQLSERIGKSRSAITNTLRLLKLPDAVQELLRRGEISPGHARALLAIEDSEQQKRLAQKIVDEGLSVREIENETQKIKGTKNVAGKNRKATTVSVDTKTPETSHYVEQLQYRYGTSVRIRSGLHKRGRIEIDFHGPEDLNRIIGLMI